MIYVNFTSLFPVRLKEERTRLTLKQASAAELCGVSREIWGRYERGMTEPGGEVLYLFAKAGADIQYVLTGVRVGEAGASRLAQIDVSRLARIVELLEDAARLAGKQWTVKKLTIVAAEAYNTLGLGQEFDELQVQRILKLMVNY